jgi:hypothetical protein
MNYTHFVVVMKFKKKCDWCKKKEKIVIFVQWSTTKKMGMSMKDEQVFLQKKILFGNHFFVHNGAHIKTHECPYKK